MQTDKKEVQVDITNRTILRILIIVLGVGLIVTFVGKIIHPLTLVFMAFFLALALNPAVSWIMRRLKIESRIRAVGVAYVTVLVLLSGFFMLTVPPLVNQTRDFINNAPSIVGDFKTQDSSAARLARRYNVITQLEKGASDFKSRFTSAEPVLSTGKRIGVTFISIITVIVMTFMMLVEGPGWLAKFWAVMPRARREHRMKIAHKMYRMVTGYVNGQVILAIIAGSFALVALLILSTVFHASINPIALAGIVALFGVIPMIGNPLSSIIVILVCLFSSSALALGMLVYFIIYYQIENYTLQPYIQSRQNELTPLIVFVAAILGIGFGGILGAFIAIPVAGCIKILVENYFDNRQAKVETA